MKQTLTQRAVQKVIECIDSCTNLEHIIACEKMLGLVYRKPYSPRPTTMTYLTLKLKKARMEITR